MTLLHATARTMLASYFVVNGVKAVRNPEPLVPIAEPVADKVAPLLKQYAPAQVSDYVPEDTATLVRAHGALQVIGGLALASGKGRRLGAGLLAASLVPSTVAKHPFWQETDPEAKARERNQFLKSTSLFGGALLAASDTEGRPSLAWRAQQGTRQLTKGTRQLTKGSSSSLAKGTKQLTKSTSALAKDTREVADSALAEGALLVGAVVARSRRAKKRASKELAKARKAAEKQSEAAAKRSKQRRKDAKKQNKVAAKEALAARKEAAERAAIREREAAERMAARKRAAAEEIAAQKAAVKAAKKASKNIQRGEN